MQGSRDARSHLYFDFDHDHDHDHDHDRTAERRIRNATRPVGDRSRRRPGSRQSAHVLDRRLHCAFPYGTCHGYAEIAAYFEEVFVALADFTLEIISIAEAGNDVLVHWHLSGRHVGTFAGIAATGRHIDLEGFDHFILENGHVVTNTVRYDQMEFARQIKLLPADRSFADRALKAAFNATTRVGHLVRRRPSR
ncbi:ester cyclase [Rhodococcus sp. B50]|uniref:ester cyclase n=1 Tax=Rhodococcus sp. B50 TaxID=2682847 RepID=UPI0027DC6032|nr:ester cyclase [Rhodococcus sp. B50]